MEPTHHGGAPAEDLEGVSLLTSLPFSLGPQRTRSTYCTQLSRYPNSRPNTSIGKGTRFCAILGRLSVLNIHPRRPLS